MNYAKATTVKLARAEEEAHPSMEPPASCLCCGRVGTPKAWMIDKPEVYVCERCHRRATLPMPERGFATEEEGDAYTHGWFDGNEAPRTAGVRVCEHCGAIEANGAAHGPRCPARGVQASYRQAKRDQTPTKKDTP